MVRVAPNVADADPDRRKPDRPAPLVSNRDCWRRAGAYGTNLVAGRDIRRESPNASRCLANKYDGLSLSTALLMDGA